MNRQNEGRMKNRLRAIDEFWSLKALKLHSSCYEPKHLYTAVFS